METQGLVLPVTDDPVDEGFWQAARRREVAVQKCDSCQRFHFPPRVHCPDCHRALAWTPVSGKGTVWSFVTVHPPLLPAYQEEAPYKVVLVELDDQPGLRLIGNLLLEEEGAIGASRNSALRVGDRVRATFRTVTPGIVLPCWIKD